MDHNSEKACFYLQSTEQQTVWVSLVIGRQVVIVKESHLEHGVVGTGTHVGNSDERDQLQCKENNEVKQSLHQISFTCLYFCRFSDV